MPAISGAQILTATKMATLGAALPTRTPTASANARIPASSQLVDARCPRTGAQRSPKGAIASTIGHLFVQSVCRKTAGQCNLLTLEEFGLMVGQSRPDLWDQNGARDSTILDQRVANPSRNGRPRRFARPNSHRLKTTSIESRTPWSGRPVVQRRCPFFGTSADHPLRPW